MTSQDETAAAQHLRAERLEAMHVQLRILIASAAEEKLDMIQYLLSWAASEVERLTKTAAPDGVEASGAKMTTNGDRHH